MWQLGTMGPRNLAPLFLLAFHMMILQFSCATASDIRPTPGPQGVKLSPTFQDIAPPGTVRPFRATLDLSNISLIRITHESKQCTMEFSDGFAQAPSPNIFSERKTLLLIALGAKIPGSKEPCENYDFNADSLNYMTKLASHGDLWASSILTCPGDAFSMMGALSERYYLDYVIPVLQNSAIKEKDLNCDINLISKNICDAIIFAYLTTNGENDISQTTLTMLKLNNFRVIHEKVKICLNENHFADSK